MNFFDRLLDKITNRGTKIVGAGHPPGDYQPPTGDRELSEELEADYGADTAAARPPDDAEADDGPDTPDALPPDDAAADDRPPAAP